MTIEDELRRAAVLIPGSDVESSIPLILITDALEIIKRHNRALAKKLEASWELRVKDDSRFGWNYATKTVKSIIAELKK